MTQQAQRGPIVGLDSPGEPNAKLSNPNPPASTEPIAKQIAEGVAAALGGQPRYDGPPRPGDPVPKLEHTETGPDYKPTLVRGMASGERFAP